MNYLLKFTLFCLAEEGFSFGGFNKITTTTTRHYATSRKVAGLIPDEVIGFISIDLTLPAALGPGVYSVSNRNEYQELIK
jgi:hypothetical protein